MTLLNPIWLWALGGLTIPVAIHLLSRKEGKTIKIGSIRFLTETATSKFSSIRLNEVVLLALRCLLIGLIALFLAGLLLSVTGNQSSRKWAVVEKGLENEGQISKLLDSLQNDDYEIRRLSPGFPLPENDTTTQPSDYYKLSETLAQENNVQAVVIARNSLPNFKGKRISQPVNITWLSYPASAPDTTTYSHAESDTIRIMLVYDSEFKYDKKILLAALHALQPVAPAQLVIEETEIGNLKKHETSWLIWLSNDEFIHEGKSLRFSHDVTRDLIVQESSDTWILTKRLNEINAIEQHLTIQLMSMLFSEQTKQEIRKHDQRTLPDELVWSKNSNVQSTTLINAGQPVNKILILIISLVFITERILAFYRKQ